MALSAFDDKSNKPGAGDLERMLGRTSAHWDDLKAHIAAEYAPLDETWKFAGANWGWSLRLKRKKRTVLYMTPRKGHFRVGFVLGEKAVRAARDSDLPDSILTTIDEARKYAEGRGVRHRDQEQEDPRGHEETRRDQDGELKRVPSLVADPAPFGLCRVCRRLKRRMSR